MVIIAEDGLATADAGSRQGNGKGSANGSASERSVTQRARAGAGRALEFVKGGEENVGGIERMLSVVGGAALVGLAARRRGPAGALGGLLGAVLLHRGATGHCMAYGALGVSTADGEDGLLVQQHGQAAVLDAQKAIKVVKSVTIDTPRADLYRFWRNFENLPRIMSHLESVEVLDDSRSRWTAKAPAGNHVTWEAEIINEVADRLIAWRSINEATVPNAGSVHFSDAPGGRGTEVKVVLEYEPPAGPLGRLVRKLFKEEPETQVREDLRRFKAVMEAGEAPTTDGQPRCA